MNATATTKRIRRKDPRIGGPGDCAICHTYTGKKLTISKFFRGGCIPPWAVVHPNCNRLESLEQFRERLRAWIDEVEGRAVPASTVAAAASTVVDATIETCSGGNAAA